MNSENLDEKSDIKEDHFDNEDNLIEKYKKSYTTKYRVIKTTLLVVAWISFGINQETIRTSLEDLKILLDTNYHYISLLMIFRSIGGLVATFFIGLIKDRCLKYSDLFMALGNFFMILASLIIPTSRMYWLTVILFFIQGLGTAVYDIHGNQLIFRLWAGVSSLPINSMYGAYGIGAIFCIQMLRPFIRFDPITKNIFNSSINKNETIVTADDIQLMIPYYVGCALGAFILVSFLFAQYFELKNFANFARFEREHRIEEEMFTFNAFKKLRHVNKADKIKFPYIQTLFFKDIYYKNSSIYVAFIQIILLFLLMGSIMGLTGIQTSFMLTYLTKGPAKFTVFKFVQVQTAYWIFFIIGRFTAAILAFKINLLFFYLFLLCSTSIVLILYSIPILNHNELFNWFILCAFGLSTGPLIPLSFMLTRHILKSVDSFLVSIFSIGGSLGMIISQYVVGELLDRFEPSRNWFGFNDATSIYIIPHLMCLFVFIGFTLFLIIASINKCFKNILNRNIKLI